MSSRDMIWPGVLMKKLLLFDWDGTLSDSARKSFEAMCDICTQAKARVPDFAHYTENFCHPYLQFYKDLGVGLMESTINLLYRDRVNFETMPFFDDVAEHIPLLAEQAMLGIISANRTQLLLKRCEQVSWGRFVSQKIGDSTDKTQDICRLAKAYGFDVGDIYYVGDMADDMRRARAAGVNAIGITRDEQTSHILFKHGADEVINHLCDLPPILSAGPRKRSMITNIELLSFDAQPQAVATG
jgi:phosphoglycolate phosphatase-like HAD superfamily hydrolase